MLDLPAFCKASTLLQTPHFTFRKKQLAINHNEFDSNYAFFFLMLTRLTTAMSRQNTETEINTAFQFPALKISP